MVRQISQHIDRFTDFTGRFVSLLNILLVVAMCLVVALRYLFNHSSIFLQESVMYTHALIFMACMGFTFKHDEHVRVDIFYSRASKKVKSIINLAGTLLLMLPTLGFILWFSWDYINASWAIKEVSQEASGLPYVYLLKTLIIVMASLLALQGFSEAIKCTLTLLQNSQGESEQ